MPIMTLPSSSRDTEALDAVSAFTETLPDGPVREALGALVDNFRSGDELIIAGPNDEITPSQAAKILGVSRAHLYKVLDAGALPFTVVGNRDRRIAMADIRDYLARTEELRRTKAWEAARSSQARAMAIDEM